MLMRGDDVIRILSVVGARPQFVKLGALAAAIDQRAEHVIVHTGQHYDDAMSDSFFRELEIPRPDVNLAVGSGKHGDQTGRMLIALEPVFEKYRPDWVLVYGDTNSTLAAALTAAKLHLPIAHLEAGLRSFNRRMPEEHNRVLTDHCSDLLLAPTDVAMQHLVNEGLDRRAVLVGDVMTDVLYATRDRVRERGAEGMGGLEHGSYYVATLHRPDNTDDAHRLARIVDALAALDRPVTLLAHPRLKSNASAFGISLERPMIHLHDPLPYSQLVAAVMGSAGVITDSGGLQKEAFLLGVPTTTVRAETEWTETVELGWNKLAAEPENIVDAVKRPAPRATTAAPYGDGHAADRAIDAILDATTIPL